MKSREIMSQGGKKETARQHAQTTCDIKSYKSGLPQKMLAGEDKKLATCFFLMLTEDKPKTNAKFKRGFMA
ncbi:hypothetical protein [Caballeronia sordidicola]|uniref:hypothetical protein n=1 Tax=Caballeronia sordidicola TaxID=196367 RepID=UPI001269BA24|nr:hypothetical protein [Caballeronia sordidicola]